MDEKITFLNSEQAGFALGKVNAFKSFMLTISDPANRPIIEVDYYGIVHIGQDFIDKQPDEIAKAILEAIDRTLLPYYSMYAEVAEQQGDMTGFTVMKILLTEKECVRRNEAKCCDRKCEKCDLLMKADTILKAYDMAISAVKYQMEAEARKELASIIVEPKEEGCEYCNEPVFSKYEGCSYDGSRYVCEYRKIENKFCPVCGRRLGGENDG